MVSTRVTNDDGSTEAERRGLAAASDVPSPEPGDAAVRHSPAGMVSRVNAQSTVVAHSEAEMLSQGVDLFYEAVMADEHLAPYFGRINMQKHRMKIVNFMIYVLGGAEAYTGRDIYKVHQTMVERQGLRNFHFDRVLEHMDTTLHAMKLPADTIRQALAVIQSTRPQFHFPPEDTSILPGDRRVQLQQLQEQAARMSALAAGSIGRRLLLLVAASRHCMRQQAEHGQLEGQLHLQELENPIDGGVIAVGAVVGAEYQWCGFADGWTSSSGR
ncbi:hypothetical protein N2152v2_000147 [Parachlorella kessleri]